MQELLATVLHFLEPYSGVAVCRSLSSVSVLVAIYSAEIS